MGLKVILLPCYGITIKIATEGHEKYPSGSITSDLKESCPYCGQSDCYFSCDMSQGQPEDEPELETEAQVEQRQQFNSAVDGVESLLLSLACAGLNLDTPKICEAIETTIQSIEHKVY